jgi:hypothetical protein
VHVRDRPLAKPLVVDVFPERIALSAAQRTCAEFVHSLGSSSVLLIQLDDRQGELVQALLDASNAAIEPLRGGDGLAFGTTVGSPLSAPRSRRYGTPLDATRLQTMFVKAPYFVAPLVKRVFAGKPFSERISVGRARNNDILLRDKSVSKFHAWFELGDDDELRMGDARSTNRTLLNGRAVGRDLEQVMPGDELVFGKVPATLCSTELLWEALRG